MAEEMKDARVLIYGTGVIGSGIAKILAKTSKPLLYNRNFAKAKALAEETGCIAVEKDLGLSQADIIILATKPQDLSAVSYELRGRIKEPQVIVSVLTGISIENLQASFGTNKIVRAMLNLPALYAKGVIGLVAHDAVAELDKHKLQLIFKKMGQVLWLNEGKLDAFTALAGSGPAFILTFYEAMVDAGIALGVPLDLAKKIAVETLAGSAEMIKQTTVHPGELRWQISSPGGCTIAGTKQLEDEGFRSAVINTFLATHDRIKDFS